MAASARDSLVVAAAGRDCSGIVAVWAERRGSVARNIAVVAQAPYARVGAFGSYLEVLEHFALVAIEGGMGSRSSMLVQRSAISEEAKSAELAG